MINSETHKLICSATQWDDRVPRVEQINWTYVRELFVLRSSLNDDPRTAWGCAVVFFDDTFLRIEVPHYDEQRARNMAFRLSAQKDKPVGMYQDERPAAFHQGDFA